MILVGRWIKLPLTPFELSQALSEVLSEGEIRLLCMFCVCLKAREQGKSVDNIALFFEWFVYEKKKNVIIISRDTQKGTQKLYSWTKTI